MVIVLGAFVIGGAALLKAHSDSEAEQEAERGQRKGITPIYKRSSAMDAGGSAGFFAWSGSSDGRGFGGHPGGGFGGHDGGSCGGSDGGSGGATPAEGVEARHCSTDSELPATGPCHRAFPAAPSAQT